MAVAYSDDFNRADSSTTVGSSWTNRVNVVGISSNQAAAMTGGAYSSASYNSTMSSDIYTVTATVKSFGVSNNGARLIAAGSSSTGLVVYVHVTPSMMTIYTSTNWSAAGTSTSRATQSGTYAVNDVIALSRNGNVFTAYRNGSSVTSWTDSGAVVPTGSSQRLCGLGGYQTAAWDGWSAVEFSGEIASTLPKAAASFGGSQTQTGTVTAALRKTAATVAAPPPQTGTVAAALRASTTTAAGIEAQNAAGTVAAALQKPATTITATQTQVGGIDAHTATIRFASNTEEGAISATAATLTSTLSGSQKQAGTMVSALHKAGTTLGGSAGAGGALGVTVKKVVCAFTNRKIWRRIRPLI